MAHEIFGKRFVGAREAAWHKLGKVIPEGITISVEEALRIGGIDFRYASVPVGYTTPAGDFVQSGNRQIVLREPTADDPQWRELGVVSSDYRYVQNIDLARGLDAIAHSTGWKFETVGALSHGGTVFMTLRTGKRSIFGDDLDTYLIVSDGKASARALQISVANVRVVCQNTLLMSDAAALSKVTIAHDTHVEGEYGFWLDMIEQLQVAQDESFRQLEAMASVKIKPAQAKKIIDAALPLASKSRKAQQGEALLKMTTTLSDAQQGVVRDRIASGSRRGDAFNAQMKLRRDAAYTLYERFNAGEEEGAKGGRAVDRETLDSLRETPYAVLQAVTEMVDWTDFSGDDVASTSAVFGKGSEIKRRAWNAALKLTTV